MGHTARVLDPLRCYMRIASATGSRCATKARPLAGYGAVVPRIGASVTRYGCGGAAPVRVDGQLHPEQRRRDRAGARQAALRTRCWRPKGIGMPTTVFGDNPDDTGLTCWRCSVAPPHVMKLNERHAGRRG
jgi:ribosomal protein S6--L-glutamate ligase